MNTKVPDDEKTLLLQAAKGDEKAFRVLFDAYRNRLYFYILKITSSKEVTEDIVQDTFLKIWLYRHQLTEVEHFNSYIFRIAQNAVLTGLRRRATEAAILEGKLTQTAAGATPDEKLHFKLVKEILQKAVDELPEQQKKVFTFRREEGYHIKEIARMMNISEVTVKRHLNEAQKKLRQSLESSLLDDAGALLIILGLLY